MLGDQVGDHLGVGLGGEVAALALEALLERHVVLDDPIDHHVHAVTAVVVGVRVLFAHPPMGGPARVADADGGGRRGDCHCRFALQPGVVGVELALQRVEVADGAHRIDVILREHRDARAVIAAILELAQAAQQQIPCGTSPDVTNDSAHPTEDTSEPRDVGDRGRLG